MTFESELADAIDKARREALEEVRDAIRHLANAVPLVEGSYQSGYAAAWADCFRCAQSLLAADPCNASEPLAQMQRLGQEFDEAPAKTYKDGEAGNWSPDERTVRACIEALPQWRTRSGLLAFEALKSCESALLAFLPTAQPKDRAEGIGQEAQIDAGLSDVSDLEEIKRRVERLERQMFPGMHKAEPFMPTTPPGWEPEYQCPVCKMKFKGAIGYVCSHPHCPSAARCTS